VDREGYAPWYSTVELRAGGSLELEAKLVPTPSPRITAQDAAAARWRRWGFVTGGAGLVLTAVTAALVLDNGARHDDWRGEQRALDRIWLRTPADEAGPTARQQTNDARADRIQSIDQVATGLGVASVALLGAAVVLIWSGSTSETEPALSMKSSTQRSQASWTSRW